MSVRKSVGELQAPIADDSLTPLEYGVLRLENDIGFYRVVLRE